MYKGIQLELVKAKTFVAHEGMEGLSCELKYKGKKIATYFDPCLGGEPEVNPIYENLQENRQLLHELEKEVSKLMFKSSNGMEFNYSLGMFVDEIYAEKQLTKEAKKGILYQKKGGETIMISKFSKSIPALFKQFHKDAAVGFLEKTINELQDKGNEILQQEYYVSLGVNPDIFE